MSDPNPKGHGIGKYDRRKLTPGQKVVVVEDLVIYR